MNFRTVFEATDLGNLDWPSPAIGLLFLGLGALSVFKPDVLRDILPDRLPPKVQVFANWFVFIFALLWTIIATAAMCWNYGTAAYDLNHGHYEVAEGPVTNFSPAEWDRHGVGSFTVQGRDFSFFDGYLSPGFHDTANDERDSLVHQGAHIRVIYSGDRILRLEVAR